MAVILETSLGDLTIDLFIDQVPFLAANFLKLCKLKQYNNKLFHSIEKDFIARAGIVTHIGEPPKDPGSIFTILKEKDFRTYRSLVERKCSDKFFSQASFDIETGFLHEHFHPLLKHRTKGIVSMANHITNAIGSAFFITLRDSIDYLDNKRSIIGVVAEGFDVLEALNTTLVEDEVSCCPLRPIRLLHTVILDDPFPDPPGTLFKNSIPSPLPISDTLDKEDNQDSELNENVLEKELLVFERIARSEAKSRAVTLEILGDLPDADLAPPDNVLFVCKLNPITEAKDLELIFSRFGEILSCEIIRDWKTGDSLQYAFIEFRDAKACESALFKMEGCLIDDRRIHVDFCQSVSKQWAAYQRYGPRFRRDDGLQSTQFQKLKTSGKEDLNEFVFGKTRKERRLRSGYKSRERHRSHSRSLLRRSRSFSNERDFKSSHKPKYDQRQSREISHR